MIDIASAERDELRSYGELRFKAGEECDDLREHPAVTTVHTNTCPECLEEGTRWVALRQCLTCGHIGCCDSSPGQHATRHFHDTTHPVMQSAEPEEHWRWCFVHHLTA